MLSFTLSPEFTATYAARKPAWGYTDAAGNSLGELTFLRTYSRSKPDGTKERWHEVCERVINGMYSILKDHCTANRLPWDETKGRRSAEEAYDRLWSFKWTPPGRGLWVMGTDFVHEQGNSAALQNCAFVSTADLAEGDPARPFAFLMEASMLGVGVGFDTLGRDSLEIQQPTPGRLPAYEHLLRTDDPGARRALIDGEFDVWPEHLAATLDALDAADDSLTGNVSPAYIVADTREGWVAAEAALIRSYLVPGHPEVRFITAGIRPYGVPIGGFGGKAAGAGPLEALLASTKDIFEGRAGSRITSRHITDVCNHIGVCVVAGNVRRSAELALGEADDKDFLDLKNYEVNADRAAFGWVSNNSVLAVEGMDYEPYTARIADNGEPGFVYMDLHRSHGRLADEPTYADYRAQGTNPCAEQTLESYECCTLVETYPTRAESQEDYNRTLKFAYLYAKSVTLLPTHWPETNAVMQRNRRIGTSMSGMADFVESKGWNTLRTWMDDGYGVVRDWDRIYSEWLGVRASIKVTSVKPSGTVSLMVGVSPGAHWPVADTYIRRMRLSAADPIAAALEVAGYTVETARFRASDGTMFYDESTKVVEIPVRGKGTRTEAEVSVFEKAALGALAQRWWADNAVSLTVTFHPDWKPLDEATAAPEQVEAWDAERRDMMLRSEVRDLPVVLRMYEGQMKALSFLKIDGAQYEQMPYSEIAPDEYERIVTDGDLRPLAWDVLYGSGALDALGEAYCTTDSCEVKTLGLAADAVEA